MDGNTNSSYVDQFMNMTYGLRAMFYLLTPQETYYEFKDDVPNVTFQVTPIFYSFIFVEQIIHLIKNGRFNGSLSDTITSLSAGMVSLLPKYTIKFNCKLFIHDFC
jgi:alkylglycerol monooxygenase